MASRRVLGFALGEHQDAQVAYGALTKAVAVRGGQVPGVIMNTGQGSEYSSGTVRAERPALSPVLSLPKPAGQAAAPTAVPAP